MPEGPGYCSVPNPGSTHVIKKAFEMTLSQRLSDCNFLRDPKPETSR